MLILIVEGLTCICTINDILILISMLKKCMNASSLYLQILLLILNVEFHTSSIPVTSQHFHFFPIAVKSKSWMEKMSTTNYCQPWSQSLRKSARPPPLPPFPVGLSSVRAEPRTHMSAGKTDTPDV